MIGLLSSINQAQLCLASEIDEIRHVQGGMAVDYTDDYVMVRIKHVPRSLICPEMGLLKVIGF